MSCSKIKTFKISTVKVLSSKMSRYTLCIDIYLEYRNDIWSLIKLAIICAVTAIYSGSEVPTGFVAQAIHGFVEELVVNDDPEYQVHMCMY